MTNKDKDFIMDRVNGRDRFYIDILNSLLSGENKEEISFTKEDILDIYEIDGHSFSVILNVLKAIYPFNVKKKDKTYTVTASLNMSK